MPLNKRFTVYQLQELYEINRQSKLLMTNHEDFLAEFQIGFKFQQEEQAEEISHFYNRLYRDSATLAEYWQLAPITEWIKDDSKVWTFITDKKIATKQLPADYRYSSINYHTQSIYTLNDELYYLAEKGFTRIERERTLIHQLLTALTEREELTKDIWLNRGRSSLLDR